MKSKAMPKQASPRVKKTSVKPDRGKRAGPLSTKQLVAMFESMNDGVVVLNHEWQFTYVNQKATSMLRRQKPSDLIGKHIWTEFPEAENQMFHASCEKAMREQVPLRFEDYYEPWDMWFENRIYPSPDGLLILFSEVAQREKVEGLLHERQYFLQKILDTEPGTVYIYDLDEHRNVYVNRHWLSEFGYTPEETQAMGEELLAQVIHPEDLTLINTYHENWRSAGESDIREIEYRVRTKTGEWRWVHSHEAPFLCDPSGAVKQILGISYEVTPRRAAQEALRQSEEKFSKVFHASPIPLSITRLSDWTFIDVNNSFLERLGYQREEVIGRSAQELGLWVSSEDRDKMLGIVDEKRSLRNFETKVRTKSGQIATTLLFREIIELDGEEYFIGTSLDITERKQMEEILRQSEQRYQLISSVTSDYMFSSRLDEDGVLTLNWAAGAFEAITGYSMDEYRARGGWRATLHPDDLPIDDHALEQLHTNQPVISEVRTFTKDGRLVWVRVYAQPVLNPETGQLIGIHGAVQDITDRKQAEEALAISESELRALFSAMNDVVLVIDREGVYQKIAPTNPRLLYKPKKELMGKSMREVFPAELAESFIQSIQTVIKTGHVAHIEYPLEIDGEILWFDASISPMEADRVLWMARDITGRRRTEEKLRQLNEELEQRVALRTEELAAAMERSQESDRLKTAFLASMSHELRTPLNSIIGFTGVLIQGLTGPLNEEQTKQLSMTRDSARHLLALINDVLDISKIEAGQLEIVKQSFDMRHAIESALRVVQPLAQKKNLPILTSIGAGVSRIHNDRRRVEQVLINLLNNAIKFTETGEVHISSQIRAGWLETSVRDTGIGIKTEDRDRLFKPFQQIDTGPARVHEGTGLGLAICKRLVTAMGGEIRFESQWGVGSTFLFTLPL